MVISSRINTIGRVVFHVCKRKVFFFFKCLHILGLPETSPMFSIFYAFKVDSVI